MSSHDVHDGEVLPFDPVAMLYSQMAEEAIKGELPYLRDTLHKFVLLDVALLGGGLATMSDKVLPIGWFVAAAACFLASMVCAMTGMLPYEGTVHPQFPDQARESIRAAARFKRRCLTATAVGIVAGFGLLVFGLLLKLAP